MVTWCSLFSSVTFHNVIVFPGYSLYLNTQKSNSNLNNPFYMKNQI